MHIRIEIPIKPNSPIQLVFFSWRFFFDLWCCIISLTKLMRVLRQALAFLPEIVCWHCKFMRDELRACGEGPGYMLGLRHSYYRSISGCTVICVRCHCQITASTVDDYSCITIFFYNTWQPNNGCHGLKNTRIVKSFDNFKTRWWSCIRTPFDTGNTNKVINSAYNSDILKISFLLVCATCSLISLRARVWLRWRVQLMNIQWFQVATPSWTRNSP